VFQESKELAFAKPFLIIFAATRYSVLYLLWLAYVCFRWVLFALVGLRLLLMGFVCFGWLTFALVGLRLLLMGFVCFGWLTFALVGLRLLWLSYVCFRLKKWAVFSPCGNA
jgi:hypothetical protein